MRHLDTYIDIYISVFIIQLIPIVSRIQTASTIRATRMSILTTGMATWLIRLNSRFLNRIHALRFNFNIGMSFTLLNKNSFILGSGSKLTWIIQTVSVTPMKMAGLIARWADDSRHRHVKI
ncbi:hypothetical protein BDC45DRAFT_562776 [Circinella umbellata]|nr:hypothetical protein BDC45DRAFT_562776 [Circinella umbellata]